jgi:hypothetical protein
MAKRVFWGLVLAAVAAGGAYALPEFKLGAGGGGYFTSDFGGGVEMSVFGETFGSIKTPYAGGGAFAFFDATYVEASVGFWGGGGSYTLETLGADDSTESIDQKMSYAGLDIGLLGKYPFALNEKLSIVPLVGITYRIMLSAKDADGEPYKNLDGDEAPGDFSALWFRFGGGVDFSFTDHVYLHSGLLYGLRLSNTAEKDIVDATESEGGGIVEAKPLLGHGLELKVAVGYRF